MWIERFGLKPNTYDIWNAFNFTARFNEFNELFGGTFTIVVDNRVIFLVQFDGWEWWDACVWHFIDGGIHLGNNNSFWVSKVFADLIVEWSQLFAVPAPIYRE